MRLQSVIRAIYPAHCVACDAPTESDHGMCGPCWADTHFIGGLACDSCGAPLPGEDPGGPVQCDDCMTIARPWNRGRAVLVYRGVGRRLVLALKHGDRTELALSAAMWMARKVPELGLRDPVIVPVPLHWTRLVRRRYNQSALLAGALGRQLGAQVCVDALQRSRRTKSLDGHGRDARFAAVEGAIRAHPTRGRVLAGRDVLLIDDVMTSGATLAASAEAARAAGAAHVFILVLARVVKDA